MIKKGGEKKHNKKSVSKSHPVKVTKKTVTTTTTTTPIKGSLKKRTISKRKPARKKTIKKKIIKSEIKVEKILIENFVGLQKVMVNLSLKFDELTNKISKLLELFEISAKALAEKDLTLEETKKDEERIIKKIDNLGEQNRIIARGLTLMHERLSEEPGEQGFMHSPQQPQPMPRFTPPMPHKHDLGTARSNNPGSYEKSIYSTEPSNFKKLPQG